MQHKQVIHMNLLQVLSLFSDLLTKHARSSINPANCFDFHSIDQHEFIPDYAYNTTIIYITMFEIYYTLRGAADENSSSGSSSVSDI